MSVTAGQQRTFLALLDQLRPHWRSDRALPLRIQSLLRADRRFGSRDRRLYRELIYTALRHLPWIEPLLDQEPATAVAVTAWLAADSAATARFRAELTAGWSECPASVEARAALLQSRFAAAFAPAALLPAWFRAHCPEAFEADQLDVLLARAPLWLRLQTDEPAVVTQELDQLGWRWRRADILPSALQVLDEVDVTKTAAFQQGLIEVQDLGSQLLLASLGLAPGEHWLDACAGAGGKTLQLAALLGSGGAVDAFDLRAAALDELATRARRAGVPVTSDAAGVTGSNARFATIRILSAPSAESYAGVLVDAPCSGSGTWRRAPHLKWTTRPEDIAAASARQSALLASCSAHVAPGGQLVYATCSLSRQENEAVLAGFLAAHGDFAVEPPARAFGVPLRDGGLTFLPARHDTDGFFVARLRRSRS